MEDLKNVVEKFIEDQKFDKAIDLLNKKIEEEPDQINWLEIRGNIYYTKQQFANALNDFNKILRIDKNNRLISSKVEMLKQILRFQNLDIYESTNLNLDPWLDE